MRALIVTAGLEDRFCLLSDGGLRAGPGPRGPARVLLHLWACPGGRGDGVPEEGPHGPVLLHFLSAEVLPEETREDLLPLLPAVNLLTGSCFCTGGGLVLTGRFGSFQGHTEAAGRPPGDGGDGGVLQPDLPVLLQPPEGRLLQTSFGCRRLAVPLQRLQPAPRRKDRAETSPGRTWDKKH